MTDKQHTTAARKLMEAMPMRDTPWTDVDAIVEGLSEGERLQFFRNLIQSEREDVFRLCGISEAILREVNGIHGYERRLLNYVVRNGHAATVRAKLEASNAD